MQQQKSYVMKLKELVKLMQERNDKNEITIEELKKINVQKQDLQNSQLTQQNIQRIEDLSQQVF